MHTLSLSLALYIYIWLPWQKCSHDCCKWGITCITDFLTLPLASQIQNQRCECDGLRRWWEDWGRHRRIAVAIRRSQADWKHSRSPFAGGTVAQNLVFRCTTALFPSRTGLSKARNNLKSMSAWSAAAGICRNLFLAATWVWRDISVSSAIEIKPNESKGVRTFIDALFPKAWLQAPNQRPCSPPQPSACFFTPFCQEALPQCALAMPPGIGHFRADLYFGDQSSWQDAVTFRRWVIRD